MAFALAEMPVWVLFRACDKQNNVAHVALVQRMTGSVVNRLTVAWDGGGVELQHRDMNEHMLVNYDETEEWGVSTEKNS